MIPGPPTVPIFHDPLQDQAMNFSNRPANQPVVRSGMHVLVIGARRVKFAARAAERVQPDGEVILLPIDGESEESAKDELTHLGVEQVRVVTGLNGETQLDEASFDKVFITSGLNKLSEPEKILEEAFTQLKPDGQLVIDQRFWDPGFMPRKRIVALAREAGFRWVGNPGNIFHHTLIFQKPAE